MNTQLQITGATGYIPPIFDNVQNDVQLDAKIVNPKNPSWTEIVAHLAQFNQHSVEKTKQEMLDLLDLGLTENNSIIHAGLAKCYIAEGHLIDAINTLAKSYSLTKNNSNHLVFLQLEMVNLMTLIGNYDQSLLLINDINKIPKTQYLENLVKYYELVTSVRKGNISLTDELINSSKLFQDKNQTATLASHYKIIGNSFGKIKQFGNAEKYYQKGLNICAGKHQHLIDAIKHDQGMMKFRQGFAEEAIVQLKSTFLKADSYYTKSYTAGNIGFIYLKQNKNENAKNYFKRSLELAQNHGVFHLLPGICYYLGKIEKNNSKSFEYLKKGSEVSLELAKYSFPLKGEKLMVVEEYFAYTNSMIEEKKEVDSFDFSFAIDKSLKQIKTIFQQTILKEKLKLSGSVKNAVSQLKISPSTYSKIMNKEKFDEKVDYSSIQQFIDNNSDLNWKSLNKEFEKEIFQYLYHEYGLNKRVMSKKLGVNYTRFVSKINSLLNTKKIESRD